MKGNAQGNGPPPATTPRQILERTTTLLERLCAVSSATGDADGLARAADLLAGELAERGLAVEVRSEQGVNRAPLPVLHARGPSVRGPGLREASPVGPYLLAVGHLDTVLPAAEPQRRGGRLWATGAVDMKGGLAALVGALDLLAHHGEQSAADDLFLVAVPDEETLGPLTQKVMAEHAPAARGLWVLEPGRNPATDEDVWDQDAWHAAGSAETCVAGRRGLFRWRLEARGTSAHAGNAFWQGRSALSAAAAWWQRAEELAQPGSGPTLNAGRFVAGEAGFVDDLARRADLLGTVRELNVVPDAARVEGEARFLRADDGRRVDRALESLAREIGDARGVELAYRSTDWIDPLEPQAGGASWADTARELAARRGWRLEAEDDRGGISFSNFVPDPSALPVLDGLGPIGGGMHTRREFVELASLDRRITLLADLFVALR